MSTLLITISRDLVEGAATPLVLSGQDDDNPVGVTNFQEPAMVPRRRLAPSSDLFSGEVDLGLTWAETNLGFDVVTDQEDTEASSRILLQELREALRQFTYTTTVEVNGAPGETYTCKAGSMAPAGARTYEDIEGHNPEWSVAIPCNPFPTIGA